MRSVFCAQSWHSFNDLHRHLLLMMDFDCPLAFHHKKGEYIIEHLFCFQGDSIFCWLELVEFRLYLGASHCISLATFLFMLGGDFFFLLYMFLVSTTY